MTSRARFLPVSLLALAIPCASCYTYVVAPPGAPAAADTDVHVAIEPTAADRITPLLGPRVQTLDGTIVAGSDTALTVAVRGITRTGGSEEHWNGDPVTIPRSAIARVERRRFDALKTTLISGAIVGAALLAARGGTSAPTTPIGGGGPSAPR